MALPRVKMPSLLEEFRKFAFKGNLIDLAIAVVIGAAFSSVIKSMVDNIIMPLVGFVLPGKGGWTEWAIGPENHRIKVGLFLSDGLNFLIIAFAVFIVMVKFLQLLQKHVMEEKKGEAPTTKECPACTSSIPIRAIKCPQCTADIPAAPVPAA